MSHSVACIDYRNGKILVAKRIDKGDMAGRWEFPGGKIESGEDYETAIHREMMEEFGCGTEIFEKLASSWFIHKGKKCTVTAFRVQLEHDGIEFPYKLTEHTQIKWVNIDEIENMSFVDSDLKLLKNIKKTLGIVA